MVTDLYAERLEHYRQALPSHIMRSLIQPDGSRREGIWGHGAMAHRNAAGPCDDCGRTPKKGEGHLLYHDLTARCVDCARVWVGLDEPPEQTSLAV